MDYDRQWGVAVADAPANVRADFIKQTYLHLGLAILAFVGVEYLLFSTGVAYQIAIPLLRNWIFVIAGFIGVAYLADRFATRPHSVGLQYLGLGLYVVAEAIVFTPILVIAAAYSDQNLIPSAGLYTAIVFGGTTGVVFLTGKDFSFMRQGLIIAGFVALGLVICATIFGFTLGIVFAGAMVVFAAACILYQTSQILHHYPPGAHVAAALSLFASIATLFYYILMILLGRRD